MDRAIQLHALLGSYFDNVASLAPVTVLYRSSNLAHERAYEQVFEQYASLLKCIVRQADVASFRPQLLAILDGIETEKIFFLVDDDIFVEHVDLSNVVRMDTRYVIPSLRLGANLKANYTRQQHQPLPPLFRLPDIQPDHLDRLPSITRQNLDEQLYWVWRDGVLDWGYPLSVDGHIFSTAEIVALAANTDFYSPNTFEGNLQVHAGLFAHRIGMCFRKSRIVNVPWNKVQRDNQNIHGDIHQDELLSQWQRGMRIDRQKMYGWMNQSAHQQAELRLTMR